MMNKLTARHALTPQGWHSDVVVQYDDDGVITGVVDGLPVTDPMVDILLPAPVNAHSHAFQRAMSGLTERRGHSDRDSFWSWRQSMYRFLSELTPEDIEAIAALAFMEMLEAGYAGVAEFHYLHHQPDGRPYTDEAELSARIVQAASETGIGLSLLPVFYQFAGCNGKPLGESQRRFGNTAASYLRIWDAARTLIDQAPADYRLGAAPHSLRAVDKAGFDALLSHCRDVPIHIHIAEQIAEVEEVLEYHGARPIEYLLDLTDVDDRWCLVHATHMSGRESSALAQTGAVVGLCPITEANLGDGVFDGVAYSAAGGRYAFGTDSNVQIDLFEELKLYEYSQRLITRQRAVLATPEHSTGRVLFDAACRGGAQIAARGCGELAVGNPADMMGLSLDNRWLPHLSGDAWLDSLIFGGGGRSCLTDVWSCGRHRVRNGRHVDRRQIIQRYRKTIDRLVS